MLRLGLQAASVLLAAMTAPGVDPRAASEDAIEACVSLLRHHLQRNVLPSLSATGHVLATAIGGGGKKRKRGGTAPAPAPAPALVSVSAASAASAPSHVGLDARQTKKLAKDLKRVYKAVLSTVGLLSALVERVELLVRTVQLDDQLVMALCSAALSTLALEPAASPSGAHAHANQAQVVQVASIALVTSVFRRYPRHRAIVVEDLFPLMLRLPTSKKFLRTYSVKSPSGIRTLALLAGEAAGGGAAGAGAGDGGGGRSPVPPTSAKRRRSSNGSAVGGGGNAAANFLGTNRIQMISALILHLVQAGVTMPVAIASRVGGGGGHGDHRDDAEQTGGDSSWDTPRLTSGVAECQTTANLLVVEIAKRCARKGEEGGASEFRPILTNLVEDLLRVRFDPDFPAADFFLYVLCGRLTSDLLRGSSRVTNRGSRISLEPTYVATAFSVLGMICASVSANLSCHRESPLILPRAVNIDEDEEVMITKDTIKCYCGRTGMAGFFMVDCDRCHGWFHGSCVNLSKDNCPRHWVCDECTLQLAVIDQTKMFAARISRRKRSRSEITESESLPQDSSVASPEIDDIYLMRQLLLNSLTSNRSPLIKAAREFHLARWIHECEGCRSKKGDPAALADAELKQTTYMDLWCAPSHELVPGSGGATVDSRRAMNLSEEGNGKLVESLAATNSDLSTSYPRLVGVILGLMGDRDSTVLRKLSVKTIAQVMHVDPNLLLRKEISNAVALRFRDDAISVREASVGLVGTYVLQSPNLAAMFHSLLLEKLGDEGSSVRKRAIKIFRDLLLMTPNYPGRATACTVMLQLAADPKEDDTVRDLIHETFQALWFDTSNVEIAMGTAVASPVRNASTSCRRRKNKDASKAEERLVSASIQMVDVVACCGGRIDSLTKLVKELVFGFGTGNKDSKASARKRRHQAAQSHCSKIVSALIEQLLSFEEGRDTLDRISSGKRLVAILATLGVFAESSPLHLIHHLDTILPYLKGENYVSKEDEAAIASSVSNIVSRCVPFLGETQARNLADGIVSDLGKAIYQLPSKANGAPIEALSKLAAHPDSGPKPDAKLLTVAKAFYSFLHRSRDIEVSKIKPAGRGNIHKALSALGSICRYREFEQAYLDTENLDLLQACCPPDLDWSCAIPACYAILALYLRKDYGPTKCQALRAMNGIFIAQPRFMLTVEQSGLLAQVMSDGSEANLQLEALHCWRELLLCEEKRVESGEAREQMDARDNITVSKRISGDQDEDASLVGSVMSQHSRRFYQLLMSPNKRVRYGCLELIGDLLRQGLINPLMTIPYLLALQGDVGAPQIRSKALKLLVAEGEKRPDSLRQRVKLGCKEAFTFQRIVYPQRPTTAIIERKGGGSKDVECIFDRVFVEAIQSSKVNRRGLYSSLLSLFETDYDVDGASQKKGKQTPGRARKLLHLQAFAAQVLATLPYNNASDPLFIIYQSSAKLAEGEMLAEKMAQFLRPYGLAPQDEFDLVEDDEDVIEEAAKLKDPRECKKVVIMSKEDFDLATFANLCSSASAFVLLTKLRSHMKAAFQLSSARIRDYVPSEKDRISDKGVSSNTTDVFGIETYVSFGSTLEECIWLYAEWRETVRNTHAEDANEAKEKLMQNQRKASTTGDDESSGNAELDESGESGDEM